MNITEWLEQHPVPNELASNPDGSQYIPIGFVEKLLDDMTDRTWSTRNFSYIVTGDFISGHLELVIEVPGFKKSVVGGITFHPSEYPNNIDFVGVCLSECTKNAAKKLGNRFGRALNNRMESKNKQPEKMKPDSDIMKLYMAAIQKNDILAIDKLTKIYDIKLG
jgi:hypothetical protein